ncbi:MAG: glycosyltransferase family 2 protein [Eubacterium sp.]|nr:glycosyltransferase family 2 protein [Eubacterium sp.]
MAEKTQILLSVIIPAYNAEKTLFSAVGSVLPVLPYGHVEVLIVENGSTDKTGEEAENLVLAYGDPVRLLHSDKGVSNARNLGIREARGKWIFFLDADDVVDSKALRSLLKAAEQSTKAADQNKKAAEGSTDTPVSCANSAGQKKVPLDIVMGAMRRVYDRKTEKIYYRRYPVFWWQKDIASFEQDLMKPQTGVGFIWGKLFRTDFLRKNNLLLDPALSMAEDAEFMVRAVHASERIAYYPYPAYRYSFNSNSAVRRYRPDYPQGYLNSLQKVRAFIMENNARPYDVKTQESYYSFALYHLLLTAVNYSFNPESGLGAEQQIADFKRLLQEPIYAEALNHIHYEDFSMTRRAILMLIAKKQYLAVRAAVGVRHLQFRARTN